MMQLNKIKTYQPVNRKLSGGSSPIPILPTERILDVALIGNDATAILGNPNFPFRTVKKAMESSQSGDMIRVSKGTYDEYHIIPKSGVMLYMMHGARIQPTFNNGKVAVFTDMLLGVGIPDFKVRGFGEFINTGWQNDDTNTFVASYATTNYDIEALRISSVEAWQQKGAIIKVKGAQIDTQIISYLGGTVILEDCFIHNSFFSQFYRPDNSTLICRNCLIVRDGYDQASLQNFDSYHIECFVYDGQWYALAQNSVIEFHACSFVQAFGGDNVLVGNQYNDNSYIGFYDCKFYNTDPTKHAIVYDDTERVGGNMLKFFLNNNIGNIGLTTIDSDNNGSQITNGFASTGLTVSPDFKLYY